MTDSFHGPSYVRCETQAFHEAERLVEPVLHLVARRQHQRFLMADDKTSRAVSPAPIETFRKLDRVALGLAGRP